MKSEIKRSTHFIIPFYKILENAWQPTTRKCKGVEEKGWWDYRSTQENLCE